MTALFCHLFPLSVCRNVEIRVFFYSSIVETIELGIERITALITSAPRIYMMTGRSLFFCCQCIKLLYKLLEAIIVF